MKPELLIPVGSPAILETAVRYGADAVYIGGEAFSLRAKARNFTGDEMRRGVDYARRHGVKVYVAANILAHEDDLREAEGYFTALNDVGPDALIIADPGMFALARELCPGMAIHISTQAGNTNSGTFRFWQEQGAQRVVAARELSLAEIAAIRAATPPELEIECFVHGAMCMAYSGRCLLSYYFNGRDANRGACSHPCRWCYAVVEETRPGEYLPIYENERGTYIFSSGDLCMIAHIPALIAAGIDSFKVEGRMKNALYVATITRAYRRAIDDFCQSESKYRDNLPCYLAEVQRCTYRPYTTGFYFGRPGGADHAADDTAYKSESVYLGTVLAVDPLRGAHIEQKNKFAVGDVIEIMKPDGRDIATTVSAITDTSGTAMLAAPHAKQPLYVTLDVPPEPGDILRMEAP